MRLHISAIGQIKNGAEAKLTEDYLKRLRGAGTSIGISDIIIHELRERKNLPDKERRQAEAGLLQNSLPEQCYLIALDERGATLTSRQLADSLSAWINAGHRDIGFIIGGADGLTPDLLSQADKKISLGKMTWPHMLVRVMLTEQLWRAVSILTNHPYHRD